MKIRFRKDTNIRSDHRSLKPLPLGKVYENAIIEVEDTPYEGLELNGDNRWWRDHNGWYYWAGETELVVPEKAPFRPVQTQPLAVPLPAPVPVPTAPIPAPQPVETPPPTRAPIPAAELVALPVPEDAPRQTETPPSGEWRIPGLDAVADSPSAGEFESLEPVAAPPLPTARTLAAPTISAPQKIESVLPTDLSSPRTQRLNWGLETGQIPNRWWQGLNLSGKGIRLAMLSTGADLSHPDLGGSTAALFHVGGAQNANDQHGLGTQAAIVAAGRGQMAYGVAPEAQLLLAKIGETPNDITPENLIAGLEWAIAEKADVAALLVDFLELNTAQKEALDAAIARALDADMILLAPVGNSTERKPENRYPAALEGVLSVGAHHQFNRRADFSAKSYALDFLAPGEGLNTSNLQKSVGVNLKTTAVATAFAAGFVALLRQWEKQRGRVSVPNDLAALLRDTAFYEGINKGKDTEMGFGLLNPAAVLERLHSGSF